MFTTTLRFGLIAAAVVIAAHIVSYNIPAGSDAPGNVLEWASLVVAMVVLYFGVRAVRIGMPAGRIPFTTAVTVGAMITVMILPAWIFGREIVMAEQLGTLAQGSEWTEIYNNPVVRWVMAAGEILPVGLVASVIAAFVESRRGTSS